jgi:hypothetical protein
VLFEPAIGDGRGEFLVELHVLGRAEIECAAGVVFAVPRGGNIPKDFTDALAGGEVCRG